jgi:hypothetical protein
LQGKGTFAPLLEIGCTFKIVATFKIKRNNQCADELMGRTVRRISLIGFSTVNAVSDAAFCGSSLSDFTLDAYGNLRTQSRYVSTFAEGGTTFLTIQIGSPLKFVWDRAAMQLKVIDSKNPSANLCVSASNAFLVVLPCSSVASNAISYQML